MNNSGFASYNFIVLGCVSSGKSTFINNIFKSAISQTHMLRTTMLPFRYEIQPGQTTSKDEVAKTLGAGTEINKKILSEGLTLETLMGTEVVFKIGSEFLEEIGVKSSNFGVSFTEMPGLNDRDTSDMYYQYLEELFKKQYFPGYYFGTIILLVDINQGMNTADSVKILDFLSAVFSKYPHYRANLFVLINKCDEMQLSKKKELELKSKQLRDMEKQIKDTVKQKLAGARNANVSFHLISTKQVMQSRSNDVDTLEQQDIDFNNVLQEYFSKREIAKMDEDEKRGHFLNIKKNEGHDQLLDKESGCAQLFAKMTSVLSVDELALYFANLFSGMFETKKSGLDFEQTQAFCEEPQHNIEAVEALLKEMGLTKTNTFKTVDTNIINHLTGAIKSHIVAIATYEEALREKSFFDRAISWAMRGIGRYAERVKPFAIERVKAISRMSNKTIAASISEHARAGVVQNVDEIVTKLQSIDLASDNALETIQSTYSLLATAFTSVPSVQLHPDKFARLFDQTHQFVANGHLKKDIAVCLGYAIMRMKVSTFQGLETPKEVKSTSQMQYIFAINYFDELKTIAKRQKMDQAFIRQLKINYISAISKAPEDERLALCLKDYRAWFGDMYAFAGIHALNVPKANKK